MTPPSSTPSGRETRLLLLVVVVAIAMLLVLARFRYPSPERVAAAPVAGPIERLAARATFEELALIMADLSARVQPTLSVVVLERVPPEAPPVRRGRPAPPPVPTEQRLAVALRVDADHAVAHLPVGFRIAPNPDVVQVAQDEARGLVFLRLPTVAFTGPATVAEGLGGPSYVAVFEGARGGPAARPLFIGRVDSFQDERWSLPLLSVGGEPQLGAGTLVYTLDGRFLGMTLPDGPGLAIVRVPALLQVVEGLRPQ